MMTLLVTSYCLCYP